VKKGEAELQLARHEAAIATLTKVLALAPGNDEARLYRAVANLSSGRLEAARKDYEQLLHKSDHLQNALFGLGAIAWRQRDTNAAIQFYQRYLSNGVPASAQFTVAAERLQQLKGR
jgi:tetratricopeptide (TPR) repeat protein